MVRRLKERNSFPPCGPAGALCPGGQNVQRVNISNDSTYLMIWYGMVTTKEWVSLSKCQVT